MKRELIVTASFGLEAVVRREVEALGYRVLRTEDGKVTFEGDDDAIAKCNLWLRTADRVLLKMGEFIAEEFEELYQMTKGIAWERLIPADGKFTVIGSSVKSVLHSVPACQSIVKKAVVDRLADFYAVERLPETGAEYTIKVTFLKNRATLTVDTTGEGLHKRGYRVAPVAAPLKETLAAAMVELSFWKEGRFMVDPTCGSGTIAIEAALIGRNIAPGIARHFAAEEWDIVPEKIWKKERKAAHEAINKNADIRINASDISTEAIEAAKQNAEAAGVADCIEFTRMDIKDLKAKEDNGIMIMNPPYGARIGDKKMIDGIFSALGAFFEKNPTWSLFFITADKTAEMKTLGRKADRRRKLYNGNIEVTYYQFHGEKPRRKVRE